MDSKHVVCQETAQEHVLPSRNVRPLRVSRLEPQRWCSWGVGSEHEGYLLTLKLLFQLFMPFCVFFVACDVVRTSWHSVRVLGFAVGMRASIPLQTSLARTAQATSGSVSSVTSSCDRLASHQAPTANARR